MNFNRFFRFTVLFTFFLLSFIPLKSQIVRSGFTEAGAIPGDKNLGFQPNFEPTLEVPRTDARIEIDGTLSDAGWQGAAYASQFAETQPGDLTRPPVRTEVFITYDDENLYIAFLAHDDPQTVRASLRDRDRIWQDDNVGIIIDTYAEASWAYEIFANPLGVQGDILLTSSQGEDTGFDLVYETSGMLTDSGFQVEMAIPFNSLRFPSQSEQVWKANFWRNHPRKSRRQYSWAAIDRDEPCWLCQFGTLTGIKNVNPGNPLGLLPSVIASQNGEVEDISNPGSPFKNEQPDGEVSLGLRYAFSPSVIGEATYNPDFSQVESDAAQIDVNTTFALFFPEKRPFFQEGSDLFESYFDIFYTRSINDPIAAAKLTGRLRRWNIAYLAGRDQHSPLILPFEERSAIISAGKSTSNILRVRRTFWKDSYMGAYLTDRRMDKGGSNTVAGIDGNLRFLNNYRFKWQVLASHTTEISDTSLTTDINDLTFDQNRHTAGFDGESFWGSAYYLSLERDARLWNFNYDYYETGPAFRADNGFITRNNYRRVEFWNGWFFRPNTALFDRITPSFVVGRIWNMEGAGKDQYLRPELDVDFKTQTNLELAYLWSKERFHHRMFGGIRLLEIEASSRFSEVFNFGLNWESGRFIARNEEPPVLGKGFELGAELFFKPFRRMVIEPTFSYAKLVHPAYDSTLFSGYIFRTRLNYQFTRELFLRLIFQYDDFDNHLTLEPLLTYRLNPFSLFYIGSTHGFDQFDPSNRFTRTSRQFFLKFQYLFNM